MKSRSRSRILRVARYLAVLAALTLIGAGPVTVATRAQTTRPNVLFIAVDDLNHWVGHLGRNKQVRTPNIDRLAARGVTFTRAYTAAPICNPSRAALMSGLRPSTTGVYDNPTDWRPVIAREKTLDHALPKRTATDARGAARSITASSTARRVGRIRHATQRTPCKLLNPTDGVGGIKFSPVECGDEGISDYGIADYGIAQLQRATRQAVLPHRRFPQAAHAVERAEEVLRHVPARQDRAAAVPGRRPRATSRRPGVKMARVPGATRRTCLDHELMLKSGRWKEAVQAYLAAITYCRRADRPRCSTRSTKRLPGQHDHRASGAITAGTSAKSITGASSRCGKKPTRAPLIWVAPGVTKAGTASSRTVDFMSIYPTLSELCGLPMPAHVEGVSIKTAARRPGGEVGSAGVDHARLQEPRGRAARRGATSATPTATRSSTTKRKIPTSGPISPRTRSTTR